MSLPQVPPEGDSTRAYVHFHYCATDPSKKWHAWCAGPCMWFLCHPSKRSKPCVRLMTNGKVECSRCATDVLPQVLGYLPLYREVDARPVMIVLHEYTREVVDKLRLHQRVIVGREDSQSDGVYVAPALTQNPVFQSTLKERQRPADLTETLLRIWNLPELTKWYRATTGERASQDERPVRSSAVPLKSNGEPFSAMTQAAARRVQADVLGTDGTPPTDEALARIQREQNAHRALRNGNHKPKS